MGGEGERKGHRGVSRFGGKEKNKEFIDSVGNLFLYSIYTNSGES